MYQLLHFCGVAGEYNILVTLLCWLGESIHAVDVQSVRERLAIVDDLRLSLEFFVIGGEPRIVLLEAFDQLFVLLFDCIIWCEARWLRDDVVSVKAFGILGSYDRLGRVVSLLLPLVDHGFRSLSDLGLDDAFLNARLEIYHGSFDELFLSFEVLPALFKIAHLSLAFGNNPLKAVLRLNFGVMGLLLFLLLSLLLLFSSLIQF